MAKSKNGVNKKLLEARKDLKVLRAELKDALSEQKRIAKLTEFYEQTNTLKSVSVPLIKYASPKEEHGLIMAGLSDIHGEEKITKASTNGANFLTPGETERRLHNYANNLVKLHKVFMKDINLEHLVWFWLGDMIHGFIHEEYHRTNYMTPIEAALWMTELLAGVIEFVINNGDFKFITIVCKIGNHSRTTKKVYTDEEALHSFEWGIYQTLAKRFPNIQWIIDESYFTYITLFNKVIRAHHGHAFRYMGGIGGITIPLMRYIAKVNRQRRADMDVIGHWHTRSFDPTDGYIINSSVCGVSPYSIRLGFPIEEPTQFFQILDQKRGFTINAPILVTQ